MAVTDGPTIRLIGSDEIPAWTRSVAVPFLEPVHDPAALAQRVERVTPFVDLDRSWVVEDGGRFVGNAAAFGGTLTLPGPCGGPCPSVPFSAITAVGVHPTHRRRGILRRLMATMLDDARARGDFLAGLTASEAAIYGRYGFGWAVGQSVERIWTRDSAFAVAAPDLPMEILAGPEATDVLSDTFRRACRRIPGQLARSAAWWADTLADHEDERGPGGPLTFVVCDGGLASWRNELVTDGDERWVRTILVDLLAETPAVEAALWRFILDLDLSREVVALRRPVDDPIRHRLVDPRALRATRITDALWLRILDTPRALEARGYLRSGRLVLDVTAPVSTPTGPDGRDGLEPAAGRWVLDAGPDGASCTPAAATDTTDLRLGVVELSALLAGGMRATTLAGAGRIHEERPGALAEADGLFAAEREPFCLTGF
jgi:predicted acetyltransferase